MGPYVLTAGDPDLMGMFDDLDVWLDNENCDCEGTCECDQS